MSTIQRQTISLAGTPVANQIHDWINPSSSSSSLSSNKTSQITPIFLSNKSSSNKYSTAVPSYYLPSSTKSSENPLYFPPPRTQPNSMMSTTSSMSPTSVNTANVNTVPSPGPGLGVNVNANPIPNTANTNKPPGYIFSCPTNSISSDCKLVRAIKRNPGETAYAVQIMDHIRIERNNTHLDGTPLTPPEKAAINTELDPFGQNFVRSGNSKSLLLPGGLYNDYGFILVYYPDVLSNGERGDWDVLTLTPVHHPVPYGSKPSL